MSTIGNMIYRTVMYNNVKSLYTFCIFKIILLSRKQPLYSIKFVMSNFWSGNKWVLCEIVLTQTSGNSVIHFYIHHAKIPVRRVLMKTSYNFIISILSPLSLVLITVLICIRLCVHIYLRQNCIILLYRNYNYSEITKSNRILSLSLFLIEIYRNKVKF